MDDAGITYAVTGSVASSIFGEPRMTQDVDVVLICKPNAVTSLAERLRPRFYAPDDMLIEASRSHGFANVVDNATGLRADLSFKTATGFMGDAIRRRKRQTLGTAGPEFWFVTPEDLLLMKLDWRRNTESAKQWADALSVARIQGTQMDWTYLLEQSQTLGVRKELEKLRDEAGI